MRSRLRRAVASSTKAMSWAKPGGGEEPPERVGGQLAGVEEPIDGPVQGELGRRPGEDEQDRVGIAPDGADDRAGGDEGSHHGIASGVSGPPSGARLAGRFILVECKAQLSSLLPRRESPVPSTGVSYLCTLHQA